MSEKNPHPKALEAEAKAQANRDVRAKLKAVVEQATSQGIRFIEITPYDYNTDKPSKVGRMTIAYFIDHRNVVAISTALCHPDDHFDKLVGRALAAHEMLCEHFVQLRIPLRKGQTMKTQLAEMFTKNIY